MYNKISKGYMDTTEFIEKWKKRNVEIYLIQSSSVPDMRAIIRIGDNVYFYTNEDCCTLQEINSKIVYLLRERKLERICSK